MKTATLPLLAALSLIANDASAIVRRHDVPDSRYRVPASAHPALADMPGAGHGVLIAPRWVVTAAHTLPMQGALQEITLGGVPRAVARVVVHPGYRVLPPSLVEQAMASGEAMLIVVELANSDDVALIELSEPVNDITPVPLHRDSGEAGMVVTLVGKGATGTGDSGHAPTAPQRTELRQAHNTITSAHGRWLCYVFDAPPDALPLEGLTSNGDSGGPALLESEGGTRLVGLMAWKVVHGHVMTARPGRYGQTNCAARIGHYADWIDEVLAAPAEASR